MHTQDWNPMMYECRPEYHFEFSFRSNGQEIRGVKSPQMVQVYKDMLANRNKEYEYLVRVFRVAMIAIQICAQTHHVKCGGEGEANALTTKIQYSDFSFVLFDVSVSDKQCTSLISSQVRDNFYVNVFNINC